MPEIMTSLIRLGDNETYVADEDGAWVITESHTLSDILRWLIEQDGGVEEVTYLLNAIARERR